MLEVQTVHTHIRSSLILDSNGLVNTVAHRKAKIAYNLGLSECNMVKKVCQSSYYLVLWDHRAQSF